MLQTQNDNIDLDSQIKAQDEWVAGVKVLHERKSEIAHVSKQFKRMDINDLNTELGHNLEQNTWATRKAIYLHFIGMFEKMQSLCSGKSKKGWGQQGVYTTFKDQGQDIVH